MYSINLIYDSALPLFPPPNPFADTDFVDWLMASQRGTEHRAFRDAKARCSGR